MLLGGDLGFSYLVLVVLLVLPLIVFFLRRKWRISVARTDEIKRLLVLASEEEARAEFEVSIACYDTPTVSISRPLQYQCAVCFFPTKRLSVLGAKRFDTVMAAMEAFLLWPRRHDLADRETMAGSLES